MMAALLARWISSAVNPAVRMAPIASWKRRVWSRVNGSAGSSATAR